VANFASISAIGRSIERFLKARFHSAPSAGGSTTSARLVRTEDFDPKTLGPIQTPFLSISMYRVDLNKTTRALRFSVSGNGPFGIDWSRQKSFPAIGLRNPMSSSSPGPRT